MNFLAKQIPEYNFMIPQLYYPAFYNKTKLRLDPMQLFMKRIG